MVSHSCLLIEIGPICKSMTASDPGQTPQNPSSDQSLHCLLRESSVKIVIKMNEKYNPTTLKTTLKMEMGWSN